eukprot:gnl/MRDRNA2_/MRDRNA2_205605_c0_seq1.p1 gnl/MRDRNA2_/MRDRNA2_205605_c0~~gnl/MRDRNA2_/MRDRNA2_205605_c0_seq1.p1  ORF type:complete len:480 (+),score=99.34 gnl/MRDRNA2_/MRDRNA2_205605_c0_seq1:130-1440(+)
MTHPEGSTGEWSGDSCKPIIPKREDIELFRGQLDALGDLYVNDSFDSMSYEHSSTVGVDLPDMVAGLLVKNELAAFAQVLTEPTRPLIAVIGDTSTNVKDGISVIENLIDRADGIIICGRLAYTFLKIGFRMDIGSNVFDEAITPVVETLFKKAEGKRCELTLPVDFLCVKDQETKCVSREQGIQIGWAAVDCGPKSLEKFATKISSAKMVIMYGLVGMSQSDSQSDIFLHGTKAVLKAVAAQHASSGFGLIGGNDLAAVVTELNMQDKLPLISSSSDSCLELLKGNELPGLAVLADAPRILTWQGSAAGKYQWDDRPTIRNADAEMMTSEKISKYSWSDGKNRVSIYIELDGLDEVAEDAFKADSGARQVSLTIESVNGRNYTFAMARLLNEITGSKVVQKKGKNMVVLQLQKKEQKSWQHLQAESTSHAPDDGN